MDHDCLFVCGLSSHRRIFHSYGDVTIADEGLHFDLCSALMVIEQREFFSEPHLLWHWISVYNGHPRGPVTLTPIAERLTVELSLPVFTVAAGIRTPNLPLARLTLWPTATPPQLTLTGWSAEDKRSKYSQFIFVWFLNDLFYITPFWKCVIVC